MSTPQKLAHYSRPSIILHWLMVAVIVAVYAAIELRGYWPRGSETREALKSWHFTLGLLVMALVWLRIAARLIWPGPAPLDEPRWRKSIAMVTHIALYMLMIVMPIAGWVILSAEAKPIIFFGLQLPPLTSPNEALAHQVEEVHELIGTIGYWLIGLHAAASLFHHYILKDMLLSRMALRRS